MRRRLAIGLSALAALAAAAATATATPPGVNGIFAIDGVTATGNIHVTPSTPGGSFTRLTFDAAQENDAAWSPDGTRIAFTSRRDGDAEIYVMNADGSNQVRFTVSAGADQEPTWSPDGSRLAWSSDRDGDLEIYSANLDRSGLRQHTLNGAFFDINPEWSPDGSAIAFESGRTGGGDVYRLSPTGTEVDLRRLTSDGSADGSPTWSPDGSRIAFDSGRTGGSDIYSVTSAGTTPEAGLRRHTSNAQADQDPVWSPNGARIAFASFRNTADWNIWTVASEGAAETGALQITSAVTNEFRPAWQSVAPAPVVTSLSPPSAFAGSGDLAVIVDGTGFVRRSQVSWNGGPRSTQFVSATRLTFVVPAADLAAPGTAAVTVSTSPVGGGTSGPLTFTVSPPSAQPLAITRATIEPRWKASRLRGRLRLAGTVGRPALLQARVLRPSGRGRAFVTRRFRVRIAGTFTRRLALVPKLLPGRYLVRVSEVGGGAASLPPAQRTARLAAPREGVAARAFIGTKIGGRALTRITGRPSIIFAHFAFAARPKRGKRLTVSWFRPGTRRPVAVDRKPIRAQVIAFVDSNSPLPTGNWRAELRYGGKLVATARTRLV